MVLNRANLAKFIRILMPPSIKGSSTLRGGLHRRHRICFPHLALQVTLWKAMLVASRTRARAASVWTHRVLADNKAETLVMMVTWTTQRLVGEEGDSESSSIPAARLRLNLPIRSSRRWDNPEVEHLFDWLDDTPPGSSPEPTEPVDGASIPFQESEPAETHLAPEDIDWDVLFDLPPRPDAGRDLPSQGTGPAAVPSASAEPSTTLVASENFSDVSSGYGTESAPGVWSDDEDEEEQEEGHWVRDRRVIPVNGIPITDPGIAQIRHAFQNTMSNIDVRQIGSLDIRYAPGPYRNVVHASPRDPSTRVTNFLYISPQGAGSMEGVASISTEGLRTVIQAMRLVSAPVLGEHVPTGELASHRASVWSGDWVCRHGRFGHESNGHIEVLGVWDWADPWSPAGARAVLQMMQEAARLRGSWRVLFTTRPPRLFWPWPVVHVKPM